MTSWIDATEQAELIRRGDTSPAELLDEALARAQAVNETLNAIVIPTEDEARNHVAANPGGPFGGVPMVTKDLGATSAGQPYYAGTRFLKAMGYRATIDSNVALRFRDGGLVSIGRTNTPEFGSITTTEPLSFGPSRNPWNIEHSTGGSSGGSAAAVAAGVVAIGHASDGGGSIRIPAAECGLVGLKPSRGRVSAGPEAGETWSGLATDGVVTRTVRDSARTLDVLAGPTTGDPYTIVPPDRPFSAEVGADPGRLRIGVVTSLGGEVHPEIDAAVGNTMTLLAGLGHEVGRSHPDALGDPGFARSFARVVGAHIAADVASWERTIGRSITPDDIEPMNWDLAAYGRRFSGPQLLGELAWLHGWSRRVAGWWEDYDVLVTPTMPVPPPPLGWYGDPQTQGERVVATTQFTAPFNVTGQPAVSVPLHWSADQLPVGVQFVGGSGAEATLIRLAAQLETAAPWADRTPPVWAPSR